MNCLLFPFTVETQNKIEPFVMRLFMGYISMMSTKIGKCYFLMVCNFICNHLVHISGDRSSETFTLPQLFIGWNIILNSLLNWPFADQAQMFSNMHNVASVLKFSHPHFSKVSTDWYKWFQLFEGSYTIALGGWKNRFYSIPTDEAETWNEVSRHNIIMTCYW